MMEVGLASGGGSVLVLVLVLTFLAGVAGVVVVVGAGGFVLVAVP